MSFIDEDAEVLLDLLVNSFGLTIGLGVIGGREIGFYSGHRIKIPHGLGCELRSSIADGFSRESKLGPKVILINACSAEGGEFHVGRECDDVFGKAVNDHNDGVVSG